MRRQGIAIVAGLALALVLVLAGSVESLSAAPSAPSAGKDRCRGQDELVTEVTIREAEYTLLCLINVHRAANSAEPVAYSLSLYRAARKHSEDLVARDFWNDRNPDGLGPHERAESSGYPITSTVGESFVTDPNATANSLFSALVAYSSHNANILSPEWVGVGAGLSLGTPEHKMLGPGGATGTLLFGNVRDSRGAEDTGIQMLVKADCAPARARRSEAAKEVRQDRAALAAANTEEQERDAKRELAKSLRALARAVDRVDAACHPTSY